MRKGKGTDRITITEETYLEGADVTLEPGDVIEVYSAGTNLITESMDDWSDLTFDDWELMTVSQAEQYLNSRDVNVKDKYGLTPLMLASRYNSNPRVIQVFIDNGANVNARDKYGRTAVMYASLNSINGQVIQVLIDARANVNLRGKPGESALGWAYKTRRKDVIQLLIDNGARED